MSSKRPSSRGSSVSRIHNPVPTQESQATLIPSQSLVRMALANAQSKWQQIFPSMRSSSRPATTRLPEPIAPCATMSPPVL